MSPAGGGKNLRRDLWKKVAKEEGEGTNPNIQIALESRQKLGNLRKRTIVLFGIVINQFL